MRTVLSVYLILATLVTPGGCCCAPRSLAAALGPASPSAGHSASDALPDVPSCCRHQRPSRPSGPPAAPPPCRPLGDLCSHPVFSEDDAGGPPGLSFDGGLVAPFLFRPWPVLASADGLACPPGNPPAIRFLNARDLLRAHHLLRC